PPATKANLPEQIRQAQTELKRLGCFDGELDGKMSTAEKAVKAFWHFSRKPVPEINITDDFINDLQRHPDDFCVPPGKKPPAFGTRPSPHNKGTAAASPPPATTPREARQPPPVQQPARATAEARQQPPAQQPAAPRATGIGF